MDMCWYFGVGLVGYVDIDLGGMWSCFGSGLVGVSDVVELI